MTYFSARKKPSVHMKLYREAGKSFEKTFIGKVRKGGSCWNNQ